MKGTNYTQLNNKTLVAVVDRFGHQLDAHELRNIPLLEIFPNEQFAMIQWTAKDAPRPSAAELQEPVIILDGVARGLKLYGHYGWGSAVKRGETIGLTNDWPVKKGPFTVVEDGQRLGRWMFSQGNFGGFKAKTLRIKIMQPHEICKAGPVEDGFGYISADLVEKFGRKEVIVLGASRDNWTFWDRLPWPAIADGAVPMIIEAATDAANPSKMLRAASHSFDVKQRMVNADIQMSEHPFVAASLNRSSQDYFSRLCSAIYVDGKYRIAVPTTEEQICWPDHAGHIVVDRSPIDSNGNIQAVELVQTRAYQKEGKRIKGMKVVQGNVSAANFMSKDCWGVVSPKLLDGYDMIICSEDIKMIGGMSLKDARNLDEIVVENCVVPFLSMWGGESLVGVNASWAKNLMGLDHDGDAVRLIECEDKMWLWYAARGLDPQETPKLPKSKRLLSKADLRAEMIAKSMSNLVGMATKVAGATFAQQNRAALAVMLGYTSDSTMDARLNFWIKCGTDGFKTDINLLAIESEIMTFQSSIRTLFGHGAAWMDWAGSQWAFSRGAPSIIHAVVPAGTKKLEYEYFEVTKGCKIKVTWKGKSAADVRYIVDGQKDPVELDDEQLKYAIWPEQDGTCAMIARYALPVIAADWAETVQFKRLTFFLNWALPQSDELMRQAEQVQFWYNSRVQRVNWTDPKDIAAFRVSLNERIEEWHKETKASDWEMANALWIVAHSARSEESTGNSVFMAFLDQAEKIIKDKPGLAASQKSQEIILNGLAYQLPGFTNGELENIEVKDIVTLSRGKKLVRRVVCGSTRGQKKPQDKSLPENLRAVGAINCAQPEPGTYRAKSTKFGDASWKAVLS